MRSYMSVKSNTRALTLVDVLVLVGGMALLATVMLPTLRSARARDHQAVCLANLRQLAAASLVYAADDPREQLVPLNKLQVLGAHAIGWAGTTWSWCTGLPYAYGGRTPSIAFPTEAGLVRIMLDEDLWGAPHRPLNAYVAEMARSADWMTTFQCPADTGFPEAIGAWEGPPAPVEAAGLPCYDILGNSYRYNSTGMIWIGGSLAFGLLTSGSLGHTPDSILDPSLTVLYSEPLFYGAVRALSMEDAGFEPIVGWHGQFMADNVAYCDGSARLTEIGELYEWTDEELEEMGVTMDARPGYFLRRGPGWQMDSYPAPGAFIKGCTDTGQPMLHPPAVIGSYSGWPFDNYTENECTFEP